MENKRGMNSVNKTLYIPLYGKAYVSKKGLFLCDKKAEEIWSAEEFPLKGKSKSKWLAYYMGIRAAVFDGWVRARTANDAVTVIHIGCGMDSRFLRAGENCSEWYDVDFPEVIEERRRYYEESDRYQMLAGDARAPEWLMHIPCGEKAVVIMEGISMYLTLDEMQALITAICRRFDEASLLVDCYTSFAAKMSKYKNPVNDVGVTKVYGLDDPTVLQVSGLSYVKEREMTPKQYVDELCGTEKKIFGKLYAGSFSKKLYRLYEYEKKKPSAEEGSHEN